MFSKATSHEETSRNGCSPEVDGCGRLQLVKLAREPASRPSVPYIPQNTPIILPVRHSSWVLVRRKQTVVRDQLYPQKPPGLRSWISHATDPFFFSSSTIELLSALAKSGAYSSYRTCHVTLAHAAVPYQTFRDIASCLLCATNSRRAPIWSSKEAHWVILNPLNCRCVSIDRLDRAKTASWCHLFLRASPVLHPWGRLSHTQNSKTMFRVERARDEKASTSKCYFPMLLSYMYIGHTIATLRMGFKSKYSRRRTIVFSTFFFRI